jgi:deoxyribodipyrimidine photolyase-related protein
MSEAPRLQAKAFHRALADRAQDPAGRTWVYLAYDQLNEALNPLPELPPERLGLVFLESPWKGALRPYHRQKVATLLANGRHFALELAERGWAVRHEVLWGPYAPALRALAQELGGPIHGVWAAEREHREALAPALAEGSLLAHPHRGWLTSPELFHRACGAQPPYRMDAFYRQARLATGWLLDEQDRPLGGRWSLDRENRLPWKGQPPAPEPPRFTHDEVSQELFDLIEAGMGQHPGRLDPGAIAATRAQVEAWWAWALQACLPHFGPFEDAMSEASWGLFHTRISPYLNLHRLMPKQVVEQVLALDSVPLPSREGFLRQVLGWREFVRHVHEATDGLRQGLPAYLAEDAALTQPGTGGHEAWAGRPWIGPTQASQGGARPNFLEVREPLPQAFWGRPSGARCLDEVVAGVWATGYSHHISRLMVLANWAQLLDVEPRELADWFWVAYVDAYDWVVEPNVLGMATYATGPLMTTKPYVAGSAYLAKMGDYCGACAFDPKKSCPLGPMYWAYLARHEAKLGANPRLAMPYASLRRRSPEQRAQDLTTAQQVQGAFRKGQPLPEALGLLQPQALPFGP